MSLAAMYSERLHVSKERNMSRYFVIVIFCLYDHVARKGLERVVV